MNGTSSLNANSYISISLMVVIISATIWLNNSLSLLNYRMTNLEKFQSRPDPWTGNDMFRWSVEMKRLNPILEVPEPRHKSEP